MTKISNLIKALTIVLFITSCGSNEEAPIDNKVTVSTQDMIFSIAENPDLNKNIGTIIGTTNQGSVKFSITSQTPKNAFSINEESGQLFVKTPELYNYETLKIITGTIKVYNGNVSKESKITINITDKDDIYFGDIHLKTQEEVDEFASKYYNVISGNLYIGFTDSGTKITNLSNLLSLRRINGNFVIGENPELVNLEGLNNLTTTKVIAIVKNDKLKNVSALNNLVSAESLRLESNPLIETIECFSKITSLKGFLDISFNSSLINLNGLHNITSVQSSLQIYGNIKLLNLSGLTALKTANSLGINYNQLLSSLDGLNSLEEIKQGIQIWDNENLSLINKLDNIKTLTNINIRKNPKLESLNGFSSLIELTGVNSISITQNHSLTNLTGLHNLKSITGKVIIDENEKLSEINALNNITSLKVLEVKNNVSLVSLNGLSGLTNIESTLNISQNDALTTLDGLDNLETIKENLYIQFNDELKDFCSLTKLVNNGFPPVYIPGGNKYDPSLSDLKNGNCSL